MKRIWTETSTSTSGGVSEILLDGKPVRLPGGKILRVASTELAAAIAAEWAAVPETFALDELPLTRLAATATERVRPAREQIIDQLVEYGLNDLLCYRSASEPALAAREAEIWQPWLDWAERRFGIQLRCGSGILPVHQPTGCSEKFAQCLRAMTDEQLAGLGVIVPALGSLVLGLAVETGALTPAAACCCAHLEQDWQAAAWGEDAEALRRRRGIEEDVAAAARFMVLCRA